MWHNHHNSPYFSNLLSIEEQHYCHWCSQWKYWYLYMSKWNKQNHIYKNKQCICFLTCASNEQAFCRNATGPSCTQSVHTNVKAFSTVTVTNRVRVIGPIWSLKHWSTSNTDNVSNDGARDIWKRSPVNRYRVTVQLSVKCHNTWRIWIYSSVFRESHHQYCPAMLMIIFVYWDHAMLSQALYHKCTDTYHRVTYTHVHVNHEVIPFQHTLWNCENTCFD